MPLTLKNFYVNIPWWNMDNWALAQSQGLWGFYTWISFKPDGTKVFLSDPIQWKIYESSLSTPFDISQITLSKYNSLFSEDLYISPDWTKMFLLRTDWSPTKVARYTLSTPWDISTATQDQSLQSINNSERWIYLTPDWLNLYVSNAGNNQLYHSTLSTAWDLTTWTSLTQVWSWYGWVSIWFGDNWKMFFRQADNSTIFSWYKLSTWYDLSSIIDSWTKTITRNDALWTWFNDTWTLWFICWESWYVKKYTL